MKKYSLLPSPLLFIWLYFISFFSLLSSCDDNENPVPEEELRVTKIVWSESDYQQFSYTATGQLSQYVSQWTYIDDGSGETIKLIANYEYDNAHKLTKVRFTTGYYNKYYYEGNTLKKLEEYDNKNRLALSHTFQFTPTNQLKEMLTQVYDVLEGKDNQIKRVYTYDSKGNVTAEKTYGKTPSSTDFYLSTTTSYTLYDNKKSPDNLMHLFPYLPHIKMNVNNPGKITVVAGEGQTLVSVHTYTYQYTEKGYPASKTIRIDSSPTVPPISATYYYE